MFKTYNVKTAQQGTETLPFVGPKLWLYLKKVYGIRGQIGARVGFVKHELKVLVIDKAIESSYGSALKKQHINLSFFKILILLELTCITYSAIKFVNNK